MDEAGVPIGRYRQYVEDLLRQYWREKDDERRDAERRILRFQPVVQVFFEAKGSKLVPPAIMPIRIEPLSVGANLKEFSVELELEAGGPERVVGRVSEDGGHSVRPLVFEDVTKAAEWSFLTLARVSIAYLHERREKEHMHRFATSLLSMGADKVVAASPEEGRRVAGRVRRPAVGGAGAPVPRARA